ncbi:MAG: gamma-glutamylcyclotransferase [Burkholderiaceae bacterium]|nr:gamma-glutamylcyclotransferase [Burkholderiaceae bacterium]
MSIQVPPGARLSARELEASLAAALAHWDGRAPLWVFGYGSLVWKPELDFDLRAPARVHGYHRRLCLRSIRYRGTVDCPGIVAGLDRGGCCAGVAFRIPARDLRPQFERLWSREMFMGSYDARWLRARRLDNGEPIRALAFVVRHDAPNYAGRLSEAELLQILARACGDNGSSLDYLLRTVEALRASGVPDPRLERLARRALQGMQPPAAPPAARARL